MRSMSLLPKLLFLLLIPMMLSMSSMVYMSYIQAREVIIKQINAELIQVASLQRDEIENIFSIFRSIVVNTASLTRLSNLLMAVNDNTQNIEQLTSPAVAVCTQLVKDFPRIATMGLIDAKGIVRADFTKSNIGQNYSDRSYFIQCMQARAPVSVIINSKITNFWLAMLAAPVFSPNNPNEILGVAFLGISLQALADSTLSKIHIGKTGAAFGLDDKGIVILDARKFIGEDFSHIPWVQEMLRGTGGLIQYTWQDEDKIAAYSKVPFVNYTVAISMTTDEILEPVLKLRDSAIALALAGLILLSIVIFFVVRSITKPLGVMADTAQTIAAGDLSMDPTTKAHIFANKGEVESMYQAFSKMLSTLKEQIFYYESILDSIATPLSITDLNMRWVFINRAAEKVVGKKRSELLGHSCAEWNASICGTDQCGIACLQRGQSRTEFDVPDKDLYFDVHTTFITNIAGEKIGHVEVISDVTEITKAREKAETALHEGMLTAANQLEGIVSIISSASTQLAAQLEQSEQGAMEQAFRVAETATAMEEMNATVLEVARNASKADEVSISTRKEAISGSDVVQKAVTGIKLVQTQSIQLKQDMAKLDENARAISQIMNVISDIADQTNLLALNAAIEAARAGDAGRGFAVVADEVRKLAEKTMASTIDVGRAVTAIQASSTQSIAQTDASAKAIEDATLYANLSGEALKKIVDMVDTSAEQVRGIATASEQQSATSEEINRSLAHVNNIASGTARTMQEAASAVAELSNQAQTLINLIESMKRT